MSKEFNSINEHLSKIYADFDETTLISPNKSREKEKGIIAKSEYEIKKEDLVGFLNSNSISINELLLASLTLTLNKFNFSDETLIFNQNNVPFATKFENRKISIKEFLENIHEIYNETLEFDEYIDKDALLLKPEFYYSFNEDLKSDIEYSNYLNIAESDKTVLLSLFYNSELYTADFINLFLSSIENIINQFVNIDVEKTNIEDIALVSEKEDIEFTEVEMPIFHKRFEEQVKANPDNIALVAEDATFTADELNQKANKIANALIKKGVKPKSNVLVMLHRNSDLIASILGILKAGCAYIPIDLEYPKDRINYIYENSQADYIISDEDKENSLNIKELLKEENTENPDVEITPDDLAYMIYTSGSTGNPKGVMISHENICNEVQNPKSQYKSLLCITTISFDVAMDDIFSALGNGIKLIFANDIQIKNIPKLTELINEHEPEVADFTPSRMASHLEVEEFCNAISCLKCLFLGGEQFSTKVYEDFRKYSDAIVYNSYGPTETTITSNNKEVTDINDITVGFPLDNYITDVRDIDGKLVPNGVMGELYIGGTGVGKGYYNMPEKTAEVFMTINDIPYYRSGDYAIELPNGEIDIKGRIDNQIKLRGLRIEIGEIETNISQYPNIKQAVVVIKEINNNDHLCAYYTADEEIDSNDLKEYLKDKLTRYMVPTVFMQLDEMPQTPNGKTDLKKLPEPQLRLTLTLPETETEIRLHEIASSISETKEFGTTDDLYAIGFTSLTLMKLNARIYDEMGVNLDIIALLNDPTIKNIANEIENNDLLDLDSIIELSHNTEYYPLTENQMGIYYECIQSGDVAQYNLPSVIRFGSEIDANRLKEAIIKTIEAYPYLKTRIVLEKSKVMLKRDDSIAIEDIPIVSVEDILDDELEKENLKPFDLHNDQLFRFKIYTTPTETILFSDVHHIISDGESLDKLFTNIANAYQGIEIEKEEIDGYINSLIETENENSEKYESSRKFFQDKLSQEIDSTVLTPNLNGNFEDGVLKSVSKNIKPDLISEFCNANKITPNALFMATTILNLNKYTFSDKTLITTIFNGRSNSLYSNTQTLLVKTLPIVSINDDRTLTVKEYLKSINDIWMETISHSDYPYTKISEEFKLKPEFFYAYNNLDAEEIEIDDKVYKVKYLNSLEVNYKISLDVNETKDNLELFIQYNDQLYSEDYIETFLNCIVNVINQLIEADIEKLSIGEIELSEDKGIPTFDPIDNPFLHGRFERQVAEKPDDIALVASDSTLTYKQLNEKSNRIANSLIKKGVEPGNNVLVMLPRTSNLIATIIGIFKAGCTFIPIDLEYPAERIKYIYENSEADYIINTDGTTKNTLDINELIKEENVDNPNVEITPDDLAYMIYTSGSTGNPKGVMISHENACNEAAENPKCEYSSILSIATIAFDTSLEDILTGITNGIKIIFANDNEIKNVVDLTNLIKENQPEVMEFTPSRLLSYLEIEEFCNAIGCGKCIVMGGEQFSAKAFNGVKQYTNAKVYNSYGPTEATIASNYKEKNFQMVKSTSKEESTTKSNSED
ncbi:non-ribosomal peptide synthetase [uncultured Methanobrevibacter sp.]|uniref:non-ribosomal peptide synthetase n=1 Tax=uncultured Methanobrevibacter sp. TaxID=253161 RepID=UPI0025E87413|nr:non-ribosomal peptide synthetase [uncultured Methanobrevibacter sp.]